MFGMDRNPACVEQATALAKLLGVAHRCSFLVGCAEECPFASKSVDAVFSKSTIQYMERDKVLSEYFRILRPGGSLALIENLPHNPLINLYRLHRRLTARTQQELEYVRSIKGYLTSAEIEGLRAHFHRIVQQRYHLFRMPSLRLVARFPRSAVVGRLDDAVARIDAVLLAWVPPLRRLAWFVAVYAEGLINEPSMDAPRSGSSPSA